MLTDKKLYNYTFSNSITVASKKKYCNGIKTFNQASFQCVPSSVYFILLGRPFLASWRTLSVRHCLAFWISSSSSFQVIRLSSNAFGSLTTLCQTTSFFIALLSTRSFVKLSRCLVCSSVNFLQNREDWLETDMALDVEGTFWNSASFRKRRTFSLLVSCSLGGSNWLTWSALSRRSFRTTALMEHACLISSVFHWHRCLW